MAAAGYLTWQVPKLKAELATRGARVTGRKKDLIERLEAYDRNRNFQQEPVILPDPLDVGWPKSGFQQLQAQHRILLPKITKEQIDVYFVYRLAGDHQSTGDIKAIEKGKDIYKGERILACSIQIMEHIFLSGIVGASMKNKVTYSFKLGIEKSTGDPLNSHCECPAGKGPHGTCKHVAAILLMLKDFIETGDITVEKSCTESLQMFHKPKVSYEGDPVEAENIPVKRRLTDDILHDPRPHKFRNMPGYNDYIKNCVTNYCSTFSEDINFRYLYGKADIQVATRDHDYLEVPFTEHWVDAANSVTEFEIFKIEEESRKQSDCKKWFKHRQWRLTASRFGELFKQTLKKDKKKLCKSLLHPKQLNHIMPIIHGKKFERKAITAFEQKFNVRTHKAGVFVCKSAQYLGGSPDAVIDNTAIVEVKCPYNGRNEKIVPGKNFNFLMYDSTGQIVLKPTSNYYYQVQGQLFVSGREICYFVVYTLCDLFVQEIAIDFDYCKNSLLPKLRLFYEKVFRPYIASTL